MKELSLLEKADAYDRVAKEVKNFFDGKQKMPFDVDKTLEYLFPELKVSEDEKIKKEIVGLLCDLASQHFPLIPNIKRLNEWIAWLEKQGEQKPAPAWSEEDEKQCKRVIGLLEGWLSTSKETCYAEDCNCGITWLKSFKDRFSPINRSAKSDNVAKPNFNVSNLAKIKLNTYED